MNSRPGASASSLNKSPSPSRCDLWSEKMLTRTRMKTLLKVPSTSKFSHLTVTSCYKFHIFRMIFFSPVFSFHFTWSSWRPKPPKQPRRPRRPAPSESEASDRSPAVAVAFREASNVCGSVLRCASCTRNTCAAMLSLRMNSKSETISKCLSKHFKTNFQNFPKS